MSTNNGFRPLSSYPAGSKAIVSQLCAGRRGRLRVCALGLTPGTEVEIVANGPGPLRVRVRGSDLVLGQQLACKILAQPAGLLS
ncbi:MAG: ferrous iron transport protein A [Desulfovibrionaceae bacterium]|jgi:ferrous iron transport protein A